MQPGLRLLFESRKWSPNSIAPILKNWAGNRLEIERKENLWIFTVDSNHPEDSKIKQVTKVQVRYSPIDESTGITTLLVEIALLNDAEEETSLSLSNVPPFQRLLPQKFILDIVSMGGWTRNGIDLLSTSNSVEFDDVEEWWEDICNEADLLPQIIVGSSLAGNLPVSDPNSIATILSGFAKVHHASSLATMEKMNEIMGQVKAPRGSIRLIHSNPKTNKKQPIYIGDRLNQAIYKIGEDEVLHRPFQVDMFLRLAKSSLKEKIPEIWSDESKHLIPLDINELIRQKKNEEIQRIRAFESLEIQHQELINSYEILDDAYNSLSIEKEALIDELREWQEEATDLTSQVDALVEETEILNDQIDSYKDIQKKLKSRIKDLKAKIHEEGKIVSDLKPLLSKLAEEEGYNSAKELFEGLEERLFGELEEEEELPEFETVEGVLISIRDSMGDKFLIAPSAIKTAKNSTFKFPARVQEAFDMMANSFDEVKNKSKSGQTIDYSKILRKNATTVFEVANRESNSTMKKHRKSRKFVVDGQEHTMEPHIKIGKNMANDRCLRIHFIFDKKKERFLIGHCGNHLPTSQD